MSQSPRDSGFTLVELMVTIGLLSILMAIAVGGWSSWARASAHSGTAREVQSAMRQAQQRAVTEGTAMCFLFDDGGDAYAIYRGRCSSATKVMVFGPVQAAAQVHLDNPNFTSSAGTPSAGVTFQSRGTGSPGSMRVTRDNSSKVYVLTVEGLTGRVSIS